MFQWKLRRVVVYYFYMCIHCYSGCFKSLGHPTRMMYRRHYYYQYQFPSFYRPLPIKVASPHLYTWVERDCLPQEHNKISPARTGTQPHDLTIRPLCLHHNFNNRESPLLQQVGFELFEVITKSQILLGKVKITFKSNKI